ncbi:MAG TPA: alpha/beta fold hydrolase [Rubricoccaceae bacterium]|jgi:methylmalonyl-CoA/ethylmalonyl-CoA epimerase
MTLDHIGIAAASPQTRALFEALLRAAPYRTETVEREGVTTVFFGNGGVPGAAPKVELLETDAPDSPVGRFLATRGPGVHHLAFEVPDLARAMTRVEALGMQLLGEPRSGADGKRIVFLHPKDTAGVLVELLETPRAPRETVHVPVAGGVEAGGTVAVHVSGEGPPLVVLHGALGSTALETDRLVRFWERRFRVLAVDLRGHGASSPLVSPPTWTETVDDVEAVADALGVDRFRLFGFSMGGGVALAAAARLGRRVERLAVHGVNVRWTPAEVETMVAPMRDIAGSFPYWATRLAETHGDRWPALAEQVRAFTARLPDEHMTADMLGAITAPTLVSHGDADRFFDLAHPLALRHEIPDARLWVIPGLDHPIQGVDPQTFARTVGDHLAG